MKTTFSYKACNIICLYVLITVSAAAEPGGGANFDPFGSGDANIPASSGGKSSNTGPAIPQVEFTDNDISMAFKIISDATGWSIFPTADAGKAKISLWAKNVSAGELLDTVVTMAGLIYHRQGNVITVMTYDEYMQYYGLAKKVFTLKYASAAPLEAAIKPFLTKQGKSVIHKETNTIVLYDTNANIQFITTVIDKLDTPADNICAEVINLKYANSENLVKMLQAAFANQKQIFRNKSVNTVGNEPNRTTANLELPYDQVEIYSVDQANQLVVIGLKSDIEKIKDLVKMVDVYGDNMVIEVIDLKYADSDVIAEALQQLFGDNASKEGAAKAISGKAPPAAPTQQNIVSNPQAGDLVFSPQSQVNIRAIARTNQLVIKAFRGDMEKLRKLIERLDTFIEPTTKNYQFTYVDASEIYSGLEQILALDTRTGSTRSGTGQQKSQGITLIEKTNSILLIAPPSAHRIMTSIVEKIDVPNMYEAGMIRIYKIENADVEEVGKTVAELLAADTKTKEKTSQAKFAGKTGSDRSQVSPASESTKQAPSSSESASNAEFSPQIEARVSVSKSTNSIVVQATTRQHRELEKLIKDLDKRRRQVLLEAMIVELSNNDNLNLGVELSHAGADVAAFSAFGLSTGLDPATGKRNTTVSPGGTAAVLRPDKVQAIIHALKTTGNARITSAPQILVNDNSAGLINSIAEEPTTQTNQGTSTTTTSFAGFVQAGTQFTIVPHISENKYMRVEYQITLNSFGTKPTDPSIPPPRHTTSIQSEATVPDGSTIIVGGLQSVDEITNIDKVPLLGDIPIIGLAFKNTTVKKEYKRTYLFITPSIMESDNFADLKEVSKKTLEKVEPNAPANTKSGK